jgi:hypothetical protein
MKYIVLDSKLYLLEKCCADRNIINIDEFYLLGYNAL